MTASQSASNLSATQAAGKDVVERLAHVYWLGGSPCAGKSSVAAVLAHRHGLQLYSCDDHFLEHKARYDPRKHPVLGSLIALNCDELWMRAVNVQVQTEIGYCREVFTLILEDLLTISSSRPVLAEGTDLLPECVKPLLADPRHAFWLVPTAEFQYHHYSKREWINDILKDCTRPAKAFSNWMGRDAAFADIVEASASRLDLALLRVDGSLSVTDVASTVEQYYGLWPAPSATQKR